MLKYSVKVGEAGLISNGQRLHMKNPIKRLAPFFTHRMDNAYREQIQAGKSPGGTTILV
jgi:hypothetical protein